MKPPEEGREGTAYLDSTIEIINVECVRPPEEWGEGEAATQLAVPLQAHIHTERRVRVALNQ